MSCLISLNLRDSATDMEKPEHPSHKALFNSLEILRELIPREENGLRFTRYFYSVDQAYPRQAFYIYEDCSDDHFHAIVAACTSHVSALNQQLLPLLKEPLHENAIFRLERKVQVKKHPSCPCFFMELLFIQNPKRDSRLEIMLENYAPGGSYSGLYTVPVSSYQSNKVTQTNGDAIEVFCIQWNTFEQREEVYASYTMRQYLSRMLPNNEFRAPALQAMGKTEEELTWQESLEIYWICTEAERIQMHLLTGKLVTSEYLGFDKKKIKKEQKKPAKMIMESVKNKKAKKKKEQRENKQKRRISCVVM